MEIMMSVGCVGKECIGCPELKIDVEHMVLTAGNATIDRHNVIYCVNRRRCERLKEYIRREMNEKEEKKDGE